MRTTYTSSTLPVHICVCAGSLCAIAGAASAQSEPASRSYNLYPIASFLSEGDGRHILAVGDSINSDDVNNRMAQGRARTWPVNWSSWTTPAASTSNWGGFHLTHGPTGLVHTLTPTPTTGGSPIPIANGETGAHARYVNDISCWADLADGVIMTQTVLEHARLRSEWRNGDWIAGKHLRGRLVFRNDGAQGFPFSLWAWRHGLLETLDVTPSGPTAWVFAELCFGVTPADYTDHRMLLLTRSGIDETGGVLTLLAAHWYTPSEPGHGYTPMGVAGWKSSDWASTSLLADQALREYLATLRNPNTLFLQIGANDAASHVPKEVYETNVRGILSRFYQAYLSNGGNEPEFHVVLVSNYDLGTTRTAFLNDYATTLEAIATNPPAGLDGRVATLNMFRIVNEKHGPHAAWQAGYLSDGVHPNLAGVDEFAGLEWDEISRQIHPGGNPCYANCDGSTTAPILNVEDFSCFINRFAEAQSLPHEQQLAHYANCDGSTTPPVLNVEDFSCFINRFAAGCP
jgi:lysophospholipase L1-like esterase